MRFGAQGRGQTPQEAGRGEGVRAVGEAAADREPVDADAVGGGIGRSDTPGSDAEAEPENGRRMSCEGDQSRAAGPRLAFVRSMRLLSGAARTPKFKGWERRGVPLPAR